MLSLIDEHDGDIVTNFIDKFAGMADKTIAFLIELDLSLTFGTGDNVEQFLFNHGVIFVEFERMISGLTMGRKGRIHGIYSLKKYITRKLMYKHEIVI